MIMVGRMRFELTTTAVSRRYPNRLDDRPTGMVGREFRY